MPFVKVFVEERELTVLLVVDLSGSGTVARIVSFIGVGAMMLAVVTMATVARSGPPGPRSAPSPDPGSRRRG